MHKLLFVSIIICRTFFAGAQTLHIEKVHSENYCLGSELSIDVSITGVFPAGNKFTVVAFRGWGENERRWEYPAELKGSRLVTILTEKELANTQLFGLRIVSSSPKTETTTDVFIKALTTPLVTLSTKSGYAGDTLNSTDLIELALTAKPAGPGQITLNTGEKFELMHYDNEWSDGYTSFISLPRTKEGTYFVREAHNVCGTIEANGQVEIKVNPIDFFPVTISPRNLCEGSEFKLLFNTDGADFPSATKFRVRFFVTFNGYLVKQKYIDVPATLTDRNELTGIFPAGFDNYESNLGIYVGIVTENPAAVARNRALKVAAKPRPGYTLTATKPAIFLGEEVYIAANPVGHPPFKFTLSTGESFSYNFPDSPETTTTYQVQKMESGCGVAENPAGNPLTIAVNPGLLLGEIKDYSTVQSFCEGQTVRVRYRANGVNPNTTYTIEAGTFDETFFSFPGKVVGDSIEFFIPEMTGQSPNLNYGNVSGIRLVSSNPRLVSPVRSVRIYGRPFMMMAEQSQKSAPFPAVIRMDYNVYGGYPYAIEMADGTTKNYDSNTIWFYQFIKRDTTFKVAAISNQCFKNTDLPAFPLTVANPASMEPALYLRLIEKAYCMGDSVEVEVFFNGRFEAGNEFTLSYSRFAQIETFPVMTVSKPGIYKIRLPDRYEETYDASLQLSSSLPRLISETARFRFRLSPRAPGIFPQASRENPEQLYLEYPRDVIVSSTPNSLITYAYGGVEGVGVSDQNGQIRVPMKISNQELSEFSVRSVSNSCGAITSNAASYFYGIAYKIVLDPGEINYERCTGMPTEVPFRLESGTANADTRFTLQISQSGSPETYTDIATTTSTYIFRFTTPPQKAGRYYIRVKSSDDLYSAPGTFLIGEIPTASIYVGGAQVTDTTLFIEYGSAFYFNSALTGNGPVGITYSNGDRQVSNSGYSSHSIAITENQTFEIRKVWNGCGYGTTSGQVHIKVKPVIELSRYPQHSDAVICSGKEIELDYDIKGADNTQKNYLVFSLLQPGSPPVKLDSVNNLKGRVRLNIPGNINQRFLSVVAAIPSLKASGTLVYEVYASPDVTLFGSNTITAGESTALYVRTNNTFAHNTAISLSDGSVHNIVSSFPNGITELTVQPQTTTSYTLIAPVTQCGTGTVSGTATVTVEPRLSQWLSVSQVAGINKLTICNSDTIQVFFDTHGGQAPDAGYTLLVSDHTGDNFAPVPTFGTSSPVRGVIPSSTNESAYYKIRLVSQDQAISGSTYSGRINVGEYATAGVLTPYAYYRPGEPVEAIISLEGSKPVYYYFGDHNFAQHRSTQNHTDTIRLFPATPEAVYRIMETGNKCGTGNIGPGSTFSIELLTSTAPAGKAETVRLGPNPTQGMLTLYFNDSGERQVEIVDLKGQKVYGGAATQHRFTVDLSLLPSGVYLLNVRTAEKPVTYRILKY